VAGRFYAGDPAILRADVQRMLGDVSGARPALGAVVPHAGTMYSGGVAGQVFARLAIPERVIILCPNHTGRGARISVRSRGAWKIPGAEIGVDEALADRLIDVCAAGLGAKADAAAHEREHAIEVELPFLVARRPDVKIVPIVIGGIDGEEAAAFGRSVAQATAGEDVLLLASSDMSHYLPDVETRPLDKLAIERLVAVDSLGLWRTVEMNEITMCGVLPATALCAYARARGAAHGELVAYATSGDASGDRERVVGYAGVIIYAGDA
jgi:AmmeMemoRadiSam system protein B